jgi:crotonobetainyl-CoA:carnitine CoA-transferase CaiB-like acyl-CoA transferase
MSALSLRGPLDGIHILDFTIYQNGPWATVMLADMGADVIKIEAPPGGDPGRGLKTPGSGPETVSAYFETMNRNKRSMVLDLSKVEGRAILYRMVPKADVVVQNFRHGVAERLGLDYATLSKHNPRIICASVTGFGRKGPHARHRVFDTLGQARSGLIDALRRGVPDERVNPGPSGISDQTGAIMLAYSIMLALFARERFGIGQDVEISQLGSQLVLQGLGINMRLFNQNPAQTRSATKSAMFMTYRCKDDKWIALAAVHTQQYFEQFCRAVGHPELISDLRFKTAEARGIHGQELLHALDAVFIKRSRQEWLDLLYPQDIICTPVQTYNELPADPQVIANDYLAEVSHPVLGAITQVGIPTKLSATPGSIRSSAPGLGQQTDDVLREFGFAPEEIEAARQRGVV